MDGLERVIGVLEAGNVQGDLWVDGSFVTEKIDPQDVDIVLRMQGSFADATNSQQQQVVNWLVGDLKNSHHVHGHAFIVYPKSDPRHPFGEAWQAYWERQWGYDRGGRVKGTAVLRVGS